MTADEKEHPEETAPLELPEPAPRKPRWTLLMVSDSGRIIRVKRIRGWITLLAALPLFAAAIVAGGYLRSDGPPDRDRRLAAAVARLGEELQVLRGENARLAALQSPAEEKGSAEKPPPGEDSPPASGAQPAGVLLPGRADAAASVDSGETAAPEEDESRAAPEEDPESFAEEAVPEGAAEGAPGASNETSDAPVVVTDLALDYNADRSSVGAGFKIANHRADGGMLYGFAFVILKTDAHSPDQWMVFPESDLTPRGPVSFRKGYDFSISNYMRIRFNPRPLPAGRVFQVATVQVYDASGRLLVAEDFQLN